MVQLCPQCHIGRIQLGNAPFIATFRGRPLVLPDAPAYTCDYCDYMEFDADFLHDMRVILSSGRQHGGGAAARRNRSRLQPPNSAPPNSRLA